MTAGVKRVIVFIFLPWIVIKQQKKIINGMALEAMREKKMHEFRRAELYKSWADLKAAHKGLSRLNKKIKRMKSDNGNAGRLYGTLVGFKKGEFHAELLEDTQHKDNPPD